MKKLVSFIIVCSVLFSFAYAEVDLSSLSYDELVELSHTLTSEIISRPEWKEVTIPAGQWVVGVDIPEGIYSIKCIDEMATVYMDSDDITTYLGKMMKKDEVYGKVNFVKGAIFLNDGTITLAPPVNPGF